MTHYVAAARDLAGGIRRSDLWLTLAWMDLRLRYRRTLLGPFWLPISSVLTIVLMGFVYAGLFHMKMAEYFPYLACGLAVWSLISSFANESPGVFVVAAHLAQQTPLPFSLYVFRRVANAVIQFLHTWVSFWVVAIYFRVPFGLEMLLIIPALALLSVFGFWLTLVLGTVSLRYRDLGQVIGVLTNVLFLVTPIFYPASQLAGWQWIAWINPAYHLVEICRTPLLGLPTNWTSWQVVMLINVFGCLIAFVVFARCRRRLAYWM